jgi:4-hydroxy-tetrahydrodipicolinate reductase
VNIGIIGYGKMGKIIEAAAKSRGHRVSAVIDPLFASALEAPAGEGRPAAFCSLPAGPGISGQGPEVPGPVQAADLFIEFTRPGAAPDNIRAAAALGKPVVCGSTGWYEKLPEISAAVEQAGTSLLWGSNFSLGVNLFYRIASYAARLADPFPEYDAAGYEIHHNKKADSPSGTAKVLAERVLASMTRKRGVSWNSGDPPGKPEELRCASLRVGSAPGMHSLLFDSPADTIEITHTARNREGFASGAVLAAEWLLSCPGPGLEAGRAKRGIFTMDDVLKDILP